jgi:hypothetical protein
MVVGSIERGPDAAWDEAPALDTRIQAQIGKRLRAMYDGFELEPLPERLMRLVRELEARSRVSAAHDSSISRPGRYSRGPA